MDWITLMLVACVALLIGAAIGWLLAARRLGQTAQQALEQQAEARAEGEALALTASLDRGSQLAELEQHLVSQGEDLEAQYHQLAEQYHSLAHELKQQLPQAAQTEAARNLNYALTVTARGWDLAQNIEQKARRMVELRRREALSRFAEVAGLEESTAERFISGRCSLDDVPEKALVHCAIAIMAARHAASVKRLTFRTKLAMSYAGTCLMAKLKGDVDAVPAARWWEAAIDGSEFARRHIIEVFRDTSPDSKRILDRLTSEVADLEAGLSRERLRRVG